MKRVYVNLTDDEKTRLTEIAADHDAAPGELLAAFVADLTCSDRTGGGDERMLAREWLDRQTYRWMDGKITS